jgi:glycosyltransferase involved in cell wall biosynthesis
MSSKKILIYVTDKGGLSTYTKFLADAMRKNGNEVTVSDKMSYKKYDLVHIQFEHALFHPFGLGLIPLLLILKIMNKKIVITNHTILSKKDIYARNKIFLLIKKFLFPLAEKLMGLLADKIIVHTNYAKNILLEDYRIPDKKVEVIFHGVY